jgi:hypothetical protein
LPSHAIDHAVTHHAAIHHAAISPAVAASHQPYASNTHDPLHTASAVENSLPHCRFTGATCTVYNDSSLASVIFYACACAYGHRPQHTRGIHHPSDIQYTGCTIYVFILAVMSF